jgi:hypothetical protein
MKNFMLTQGGVLMQIADADIAKWRAQGSFMSSEGPTMVPTALGHADAQAMGGLMKLSKNFVFWLTQDFRIVFVTQDGLIDNGGKFWKLRFEWRGLSEDGKPAVSAARFERKVKAEETLPAVEAAIAQFVKQFTAAGTTKPVN